MRNAPYSMLVIQGCKSGFVWQTAPMLPVDASRMLNNLRKNAHVKVLYRVNVKGGVYA